MKEKYIYVLAIFFILFVKVSASESLDSAAIAAKLKKFEVVSNRYKIDSIIYKISDSNSTKLIATEDNGSDTLNFQIIYLSEGVKSYGKSTYIFDKNGNNIKEITYEDINSSDGYIYNSYYNQYNLLIKKEYQRVNFSEISKIYDYKYRINNDTISEIITAISDNKVDSSKNDYIENDFLFYNEYNNNWNYMYLGKYTFNEDGSVNNIDVINGTNILARMSFYYKSNTLVKNIQELSNYFVRDKKLNLKSEMNDKLYIYSSIGKLMLIENISIGENIYDLSSFPSGTYILKTSLGKTNKILLH